NPTFLTVDNFVTIGVNSTSVLIAVLGTSALLIAGYVDLSVGSMLALIGIVVAKVAVATQTPLLAVATGLGLGSLLGLTNGVLVGRTVIGLYTANGFLIGLVATLTAGRLGSMTPTIGVNFELDVITAAILGGVAFAGGAGRPLGVVIGVATIGILDAGLIFVG